MSIYDLTLKFSTKINSIFLNNKMTSIHHCCKVSRVRRPHYGMVNGETPDTAFIVESIDESIDIDSDEIEDTPVSQGFSVSESKLPASGLHGPFAAVRIDVADVARLVLPGGIFKEKLKH